MARSLVLDACLVLALAPALAYCGEGEPSPEDVSVLIGEQRLRGEELYGEHCHSCHEVEGAIGVELSARVLASYDFAGPLYDYIDLARPFNEPGSLAPAQYWDIVAYLLIDREVARLEAPLSAGSGDRLRLADGGR